MQFLKSLRVVVLAACATLICFSQAAPAAVVYDHWTGNLPNPDGSGSTNYSFPNGVSNTFTGAPFYIAPTAIPDYIAGSSVSLTGIDMAITNQTGAPILNGRYLANIKVFRTFTYSLGSSLVFSNQVADYSISLGTIPTLANGGFLGFASGVSNVPGVVFPTGAIIPSQTGAIGITINLQVDTGSGFASLQNLTTVIAGGASAVAPAVGVHGLFDKNSTNLGYYRNASNLTTGNFRGSDVRSIAANSGLGLRVYAEVAVPEPTSVALLGFVGAASLRRRRR